MDDNYFVFHDERKLKNLWLYHGYLIIPNSEVKNVQSTLGEIRVNEKCENKRIHFNELTAHSTTSKRTKVAVEWTKAFVLQLYQKIRFYFFGVYLPNIEYSFFGSVNDEKSQFNFRIYNRFFEIGLYAAMRFFFGKMNFVKIEKIFCEKRDLPADDPFLTYGPYKINMRGTNIQVVCNTTTQISPDSEKEENYKEFCDLLNFVDVIIGGISQVYDNPSKSKTGCREIATVIFPICERWTNKPFNQNSRYWKRYAASFFPREKKMSQDLESWPQKDQFFYKRSLTFQEKNQLKLFFEEPIR